MSCLNSFLNWQVEYRQVAQSRVRIPVVRDAVFCGETRRRIKKSDTVAQMAREALMTIMAVVAVAD